jgi:hypothetical protein
VFRSLSTNRPCAKGPLFTLLSSNDYCCLYEIALNDFDASQAQNGVIYLFDTGIGELGAYTSGIEIYASYNTTTPENVFVCTDWNGNYEEGVGGITEPGTNLFAFQLHPVNGTIYAANGNTAVTDPTAIGAYGGVNDLISVGWDWVVLGPTEVNDIPIQGFVRKIFFFPTGKNAAEIEALRA